MKILSVILTLILTLAWAYTSWYWYTCNVKGLCEMTFSQSGQLQTGENVENDIDASSGTGELSEVQKLSSSDVLSGDLNTSQKDFNNVTTTEDEMGKDENLIKNTPLAKEGTGTGNTIATQEPVLGDKTISSICDGSFIGPIAYGGNNSAEQVKYLQEFLIDQGASVTITGTYSASDMQAVKDFQLKYKKDILDPWSISEPTGYIGTTTVKKIKEISCK